MTTDQDNRAQLAKWLYAELCGAAPDNATASAAEDAAADGHVASADAAEGAMALIERRTPFFKRLGDPTS